MAGNKDWGIGLIVFGRREKNNFYISLPLATYTDTAGSGCGIFAV